MFDVFLIVVFIGYIGYQEQLHYKERKQLCSRIQAKDLPEYKRVEEPKKKEKEEEKKVVHFV